MHADLLAWVVTYLVHSTLLLTGAWLLSRCWRRMPASMQETVWRTALFGGVLTATAQVAIGWVPWGGHVDVPRIQAAAAPEPAPLRDIVWAPIATTNDADAMTATPSASAAQPTPAAATTAMDPFPWLALAWLSCVVLALARSRRARSRLDARLADRRPVQDRALLDILDRLHATSGLRRAVRLTQVEGLGSPVALGLAQPEIVIPSRAASELSAAHLEAMLAHELGHHVRRDPLWLAITRWTARLLLVQPLNLMAAKRLRESSELLCDAWAAVQTGRGRELAECLTVVAGWLLRGRAPTLVHAMAAHGSMLERRVQCLLDAGTIGASARKRAAVRVLALLPLIAVAWFAPAVATSEAEAAPAAAVEPVRDTPTNEGAHALALLDQEIRSLEGEIATLVELLRSVPNPPEALTRGADSLRARLAPLKERRLALVRAAKEMN